jgi:hypothetical protein
VGDLLTLIWGLPEEETMKPQKFILINQQVKNRAINAVESINIDDACRVVIDAADLRTLEQNAKLHVMLGDISKQVAWQGMKFNPVVWKRLVTASYLREIREHPMLIPALDGSGVDIIYEKTSKMGKKKVAGLIEWCYMWGAENGVIWSEKSRREK